MLRNFALFTMALVACVQTVVRGADLPRDLLSHCVGCNLQGVDLRGRDLHGVELVGANLERADLRNADLHGATFTGVDLERSDVSGTHFQRARLIGVTFRDATAQGTDFTDAVLLGTNFRNATLTSAMFRNAVLCAPNRRETDAVRAETETHCADFAGANLRDADLRGVRWCRGGDEFRDCRPLTAEELRTLAHANLAGARAIP